MSPGCVIVHHRNSLSPRWLLALSTHCTDKVIEIDIIMLNGDKYVRTTLQVAGSVKVNYLQVNSSISLPADAVARKLFELFLF